MRGGETDIKAKLGALFGWSRPPFHAIRIIPFILGTFLVWRLENTFNIQPFILGLCSILLIMVSTYHTGLQLGNEEHERSRLIFQSRFAILSGAMPNRFFSYRSTPLRVGITSILLALLIGLILQFGLKTGPLTLPLVFSAPCRVFSTPPGPFIWMRRAPVNSSSASVTAGVPLPLLSTFR